LRLIDKSGLGETLGADVREIEGKVFAPTQRLGRA
jgi:hypothetical protein